MQEKTTLHAVYEPATGRVSLEISGDNISMCRLIGTMIRHIGEEWGKHIGNMSVGFMLALNAILDAAVQDAKEPVKIDLSSFDKEV